MKVTSVQLAFTGIEPSETGQQSIDGFLKVPTKRPRDSDQDDNPGSAIPFDPRDSSSLGHDDFSFSCKQCQERITLSDEVIAANLDAEILAQKLAISRQEHDDFHLAQNLAKERQPMVKVSASEPVKRSEKKRKKESPKGIEKFFKRK